MYSNLQFKLSITLQFTTLSSDLRVPLLEFQLKLLWAARLGCAFAATGTWLSLVARLRDGYDSRSWAAPLWTDGCEIGWIDGCETGWTDGCEGRLMVAARLRGERKGLGCTGAAEGCWFRVWAAVMALRVLVEEWSLDFNLGGMKLYTSSSMCEEGNASKGASKTLTIEEMTGGRGDFGKRRLVPH
ncbi:TANK-binding kinase 1-binding protein like [Actinidia chinensis var. chinensis]|uniref:TANK-binding kinase 1-binding protein like n=1 Tax=Actinidia chinensis var. chinensis TaxID=1590841 RepID=A0A2R6QNR0_ACTCC|nr:TANK-binding kinase 1-binding protein like [Actinidia chinensis var. chinensis]